MAIFKRTTKKEASTPVAEKATKKAAVKQTVSFGSASVLLSPRVTEKAAIGTDAGVYVFNIAKAASKPAVAAAVAELFKVTVRKVRIVNTKASTTTTRATGRKGKTNSNKKAYVYLKKGDKIELA